MFIRMNLWRKHEILSELLKLASIGVWQKLTSLHNVDIMYSIDSTDQEN